MQNETRFKKSFNKDINSDRIRKRYLNGNVIEPGFQDYSKETCNDDDKEKKLRNPIATNSTSNLKTITKIINKSKEMTTSNHHLNTTTTNATTTKASSRTSAAGSAMIAKRSLSESSAEEYYRSTETEARDSSNRRKMWHNELFINEDSENSQPMRRKGSKNDSNKKRNRNKNHDFSDMIDVGIRIALVLLFIKLETTSAFHRNIHIEELWLYKNPRTPDIVTPKQLILSVIICPFVVTILQYLVTRDLRDFRAANWVWTLCLCLNGLITGLLKISSGRPRPDFFYRCFPDGEMVANVTPTAVNFNCTGQWRDINEGYKSFPSGHSSFAFTSFGFIAIYLAGKLHVFNTAGRGETWRLFSSIWPILIATLIAVSRTCDYHHHWQDVLVGGIIGLMVAYITYRQYYPSIFSIYSHRPYPRDGRCCQFRHTQQRFGRSYNDDYLDNSHAISTAERLGNDDHLPLLCDEGDEDEQLNK